MEADRSDDDRRGSMHSFNLVNVHGTVWVADAQPSHPYWDDDVTSYIREQEFLPHFVYYRNRYQAILVNLPQ
ncbi:MAG: hypothetical protein R3C19_03575 [Planctomycetaceae bacterium]